METNLAMRYSYWKPLDHEMLKLTALCSKVISLLESLCVMVIFFKYIVSGNYILDLQFILQIYRSIIGLILGLF